MIYLGIDPGPVESAFVWWDAQSEKVLRLESIPAFKLGSLEVGPLLKGVDHVSVEHGSRPRDVSHSGGHRLVCVAIVRSQLALATCPAPIGQDAPM
jgi:hypothetical protein